MRNILVLATGAENNEARSRVADMLAKQHNAHLDVLILNRAETGVMPTMMTGLPEPALGVGLPPAPPAPPETGEADSLQASTEARFSGRGDVRLMRLDDTRSGIEEKVVSFSRTSDLVIASAPSGSDSTLRSALRAVLGDKTAAVLALPEQTDAPKRFSTVCIAWNGSAEAARAVHHAMPIIQAADKVYVVMVDQLRPAGQDPIEKQEIERYLATNGVEAELLNASSKGMDTADAIIAEAERVEADLLVAGGQETTGMLKWLSSTVSKDLLKRTPLPLLVA